MNADFLRWLYTSFDGRIRRRHYWLGGIGLAIVLLVLAIVLQPVLGTAMTSLLLNIAAIYPAAALIAKRLHDRNRPTLPLTVVFLATPLVLNLLQQLRVGFDVIVMDGVAYPAPNMLGLVLSVIGMAVGIWALVELGFLSGTRGPNRFGPDPKARETELGMETEG